MKTHNLKTDPDTFDAVLCGLKTFEIRFNDRGFEVFDQLILRKTQHSGEEMKNGSPLVYTGHQVEVSVLHILAGPRFGLAEGWVIMSIEQENFRINRRDEFATAALAGLGAYRGMINGKAHPGPEDHADLAYKYADAMMVRRCQSSQ